MEILASRDDIGTGADRQFILDNWKLILTYEKINNLVARCADTIRRKFTGKDIVIVGILKGVVPFLADLMKYLNIPYTLYFVEASSYKDKQTQHEKVELLSLINPDKFKGKQVIILDELFDNGNTIQFVKTEIIKQANVDPKDIFTCTLFKKKKEVDLTKVQLPDWYGIELPDVWFVGYGLDDRGEKRGWMNLFAIPKVAGVPQSDDDIIFTDPDKYKSMYDQIQKLF